MADLRDNGPQRAPRRRRWLIALRRNVNPLLRWRWPKRAAEAPTKTDKSDKGSK